MAEKVFLTGFTFTEETKSAFQNVGGKVAFNYWTLERRKSVVAGAIRKASREGRRLELELESEKGLDR